MAMAGGSTASRRLLLRLNRRQFWRDHHDISASAAMRASTPMTSARQAARVRRPGRSRMRASFSARVHSRAVIMNELTGCACAKPQIALLS